MIFRTQVCLRLQFMYSCPQQKSYIKSLIIKLVRSGGYINWPGCCECNKKVENQSVIDLLTENSVEDIFSNIKCCG